MRFPGASGPHRGLDNDALKDSDLGLPWEVVVLCISAEEPASTYRELHTTIDSHGALDLIDIDEVKQSWAHATMLNSADS